ncbi:Nucleotidyl transferase [Dehalogenimonas lykanthroporepellens BL-DC-9]|jgi:mannose-1-phosphate guanylyltransferase|nr:Nucleotidyl transferase [Dehalogenimonas lykanthroporepellens BL-DC-9]
MKALVLVGGLGTRLRPLSVNMPKAMMPVVNRPFMARVVERLARHGVNEVIFTRGHLAGRMESYFGDGSAFGVKVMFVDEEQPLGTAGGVRNCQGLLGNGTFLVLNGDIYADIDYTALLEYHRRRGATATIALTPVANPAAFGLVETGADGRIARFIEKPSPDEITTDMINAGCYALEPAVLEYIPAGRPVSIERETFQQLLAERRPFYGYDISGSYWIDMGNSERYYRLNMDLLAGAGGGRNNWGRNVVMDATAEITGPVIIGNDCRLGAGAVVRGPAALGDGTRLGRGARVEGSIVWDGVFIGDRAAVTGSVVAAGCHLGSEAVVADSVLADGVWVDEGRTLNEAEVWPGTILNN